MFRLTNLSEIGQSICLVFATLCTIISSYLGGWDVSMSLLVAFTFTDFITGLAVAIFINKNLNSEVGYKGIFKKFLIFGLIGLCNKLDQVLNIEMLRNLSILFYIANEGISLLENTTKLGVPYPDKLKDILIQVKDKN